VEVETIAVVVIVDVVVVEDDGMMITVTEEVVVADTVAKGHDLAVPGGIEESHEAEVALHEEDVIEAHETEVQEEVEADLLIIAINEEKEAFHQEDLQV